MQEHYEWVIRIIESCKHPFHLDSAKKVVQVFLERYGDGKEYNHLLERLCAVEPMLMVG
jgi:hypothetical protein